MYPPVVLGEAASMVLLTPAEFSIGTGGQILASDPRVQPLIDGATAAIERYCGWHITPPQASTVLFDSDGGSVLTLPTLRVTGVTEVKVNGEVVDPSGYEWSSKGMLKRKGCRWPCGYRSVEVTFTHGFDNAADVKQIVQQVVANAISSPMGATRQQAAVYAVSWSTTAPGVSGGISLLERDRAVLDQYRIARGA